MCRRDMLNVFLAMATIRERLTEFALSQGFRTLSGFERSCGFTKNTLTKDYSGLSSTTLTKIVDSYPQLSLDWVILGRGRMVVDSCPQIDTPSSPSVNVANVQAVFITNWRDIKDVVEDAVKGVIKAQ